MLSDTDKEKMKFIIESLDIGTAEKYHTYRLGCNATWLTIFHLLRNDEAVLRLIYTNDYFKAAFMATLPMLNDLAKILDNNEAVLANIFTVVKNQFTIDDIQKELNDIYKPEKD